MEFQTEIKETLQRAVNVLLKARSYEEAAMKAAQHIGLQGEKRRMRLESSYDGNLTNYLICDAYDSYGINIVYSPETYPTESAITIKGFMENAKQNMESQYDVLHTLANKLINYNDRPHALKLYDKCDRIRDYIKYYRRSILEGEITEWNPEWLLLHQTTKENIHDEFEEIEKEMGYPE